MSVSSNVSTTNLTIPYPGLVCPKLHPMFDNILFCSSCGKRAFITHSCTSCQYHLCVSCYSGWLQGFNLNANVNVTAKVEIKNEQPKIEEKKKEGGFPCYQCKGKIFFGKTGKRINDAVCSECKTIGHQFTYYCEKCDLDLCEKCAEKMMEKAKEMMGDFAKRQDQMMGNFGMKSNFGDVMGMFGKK